MAEMYDFSLITFRPTIYKFLRIAKWKKIEKGRILECGAGGDHPPLSLFSKHGYKAYGIDISEDALNQAKSFATKYSLDMEFSKADMRELPFEDEFFDLVFSYNSSIHLTKTDTKKAVKEMLRVLKKGGFLCMNFLWYNNVHPSLGKEKKHGEFWNMEFGEETVHSFFTEEEVEQILQSTKIIFKEKIQFKVLVEKDYFWESSFDYIVQKIE
jgi:ubiquinone/menaquinone biosynthesis C-methylase UbiE